METIILKMLNLDTDRLWSVSELEALLTGCVGDCLRLVTGSMSLQVLHCCVNGSSTYMQQSHYVLSLSDLSSSDYDPFLPLGNVRSSLEPAQRLSSTDLGNLLTVAEGKACPQCELGQRVWAAVGNTVPGSISALEMCFSFLHVAIVPSKLGTAFYRWIPVAFVIGCLH